MYALVSTALQLRLRLQRECARAISAVDLTRGAPRSLSSLSPSSSFKDASRAQQQQQQQQGTGGLGHTPVATLNGHSHSHGGGIPTLGSAVFSAAAPSSAPSSGGSRGVDLPRGSREGGVGGKEKGRDKQGKGSGRGAQSPSAASSHPFSLEKESRDRERDTPASRWASLLPALFSPTPVATAPGAAGQAAGQPWANQGSESSSWKSGKQRPSQGSDPTSPTRAGGGGGGGGGSGHRGGGGGVDRGGGIPIGMSDSELLWMSQTMEDWPLTFFLVLALESAAGAFWIGAVPPSCTLVSTVLHSSHTPAPLRARRGR